MASLILRAVEINPHRRVTADSSTSLQALVENATREGNLLLDGGVRPGDVVGVIAPNSLALLRAWVALQLCGAIPAFINPTYPQDLRDEMLDVLDPKWVVLGEGLSSHRLAERPPLIGLRRGGTTIDGQEVAHSQIPLVDAMTLPGLRRDSRALAGYMHTSGTSGVPKFCAQSHKYLASLGHYAADVFKLRTQDVLIAPLPLYHINPLGYGWLAALASRGAGFATATPFSASEFWTLTRKVGATVAILHVAAVEILRRRTTPGQAHGHTLRNVFLADQDFAQRFGIASLTSAYGSTEAGGLCSAGTWPGGVAAEPPEGISRVAGKARPGFRLELDDDEIVVRVDDPDLVASHILSAEGCAPILDEEKRFRTGDAGRVDSEWGIVFVDRKVESVRVKGEYVPLAYVEKVFASAAGVEEVAVSARASELGEQEPVLYVVSRGEVPLEALRSSASSLPSFMRPQQVVRVASIPRTSGLEKVRRAQLHTEEVLDSWEVDW